MALVLENTDASIFLYDYTRNTDEAIYYIRKDKALGRVRGDSLSDWIIQLLSKKWINDKEILYRIASIIQQERPENKINWAKTFFSVESKFSNDINDVTSISIAVAEKLEEYNLLE